MIGRFGIYAGNQLTWKLVIQQLVARGLVQAGGHKVEGWAHPRWYRPVDNLYYRLEYHKFPTPTVKRSFED